MIFTETPLAGSFVIQSEPNIDERGSFARLFCQKEFLKINHQKQFVQINQAFNIHKATIRGMHYQNSPFCEIKMVKCMQGAFLDVIVDIRQGSNTFLQWFGVELNSKNNKMLYVPEGFAHGFQTLEDLTQVLYFVTNNYHPEAEKGIRFNDPIIGIHWNMAASSISTKDRILPLIDKNFKGIIV